MAKVTTLTNPIIPTVNPGTTTNETRCLYPTITYKNTRFMIIRHAENKNEMLEDFMLLLSIKIERLFFQRAHIPNELFL